MVSCDPDATLESIIAAVCFQAQMNKPRGSHKATTSVGLNLPMLKAETRFEERDHAVIKITNMSTAVAALKTIVQAYSKNTVVVVDEFDLIKDPLERSRFGLLLKQLSDGDIQVRFIFTGIGQSIADLIGGHLSSQRQIEQIDLERLNWSGRERIVNTAFEAFDVAVPEDIIFRICALSDGFPYYVHLMCSKLLYACYQDEEIVTEVNKTLFIRSLDGAVTSAEETLRRSYEMATFRDEHMHYILWGMAEGADLNRVKEHIIASYIQVMTLLGVEPLTQKVFDSYFTRLRKENHGCILTHALVGPSGVRPNWFRFRENMIRGFVRMQAEKCGIQLNFERHYSAHTANIRTAAMRGVFNPMSPVERSVARLRRDDDNEGTPSS